MRTTRETRATSRRPAFAPTGLAATLLLAVTAPAQIQVRYGEPARSGAIASALQTDRYFFAGQQGDILRVTFSSQSSSCGYNCTYYHHQLDLWDGANPVGSTIVGLGALTVTLPSTGYFTITVQARNLQSTGWYAFQIDRLNDPVGGDRVAFNWTVSGSRLYPDESLGITSRAGFAVYTLRAEAGSTGTLEFTSQSSSCGYNCTYFHHYVELLDPTGKRVQVVEGNGQVSIPPFQVSGDYTLFVAARNYQSSGWYRVAVKCRSWPGTPCDTVAGASNYGSGCVGTNGVPALTATALPRLGGISGIDVGNSLGQATWAGLLLGINGSNTSAQGCTLLVVPSVHQWFPLPPAGVRVTFPVPNDPLLLGFGLAAQSVIADPGAANGIAFSPGLLMLVGR